MTTRTETGNLATRLHLGPLQDRDGNALQEIKAFQEKTKTSENAQDLVSLLANEKIALFLAGIFAGSSYLKSLIIVDPHRLLRLLQSEPELHFNNLVSLLREECRVADDMPTVMKHVRTFKNELALLVALCDLGSVWPV
ncbi:MAG: bifunctional [glutamine synthetase] adenylyltransferase/[glutamine synthetase]-adenylyl-L-tyrosine phosphorylase, partial [Hyphomicrobium sp.]